MPKRSTRIPRVTASRASERREYAKRRAAYLAAHPLDQIKIAFCGFDEERVLARFAGLNAGNAMGIYFEGQIIPVATQIHHRAKCHGARLNDERWWIATASRSHDLVENHKNWAREVGLLLPIQADADGRWGAGNQALETPAFMASRVGNPIPNP